MHEHLDVYKAILISMILDVCEISKVCFNCTSNGNHSF